MEVAKLEEDPRVDRFLIKGELYSKLL